MLLGAKWSSWELIPHPCPDVTHPPAQLYHFTFTTLIISGFEMWQLLTLLGLIISLFRWEVLRFSVISPLGFVLGDMLQINGQKTRPWHKYFVETRSFYKILTKSIISVFFLCGFFRKVHWACSMLPLFPLSSEGGKHMPFENPPLKLW